MATGPSVLVRFLGDNSNLKKSADDTSDSANKLTDFGKKAALAIGGAFAVEKVVEFGKASVDAAAEDAKAQALLAQQLKNSAGATDQQIAATEKSITAMSKHYAVADDDLRPALGNLVRATGDVTKSQDLLQIALDTSAATGKDLNTVTLAMGKAADGSTGGLAKLGVEVKDAGGKALTADQVFANMAQTFKGQAGVAADSAAGKMANAKIQFGEFQEQIGGYLIPVVVKMSDLFNNVLLPAINSVVGYLSKHKDEMLAVLTAVGIVVGAVVIPAFISWAIAAGAAAVATIVAAAPFIALGVVIAAVALVIIKNWDTIRDVAVGAFTAIINVIAFVWNWIRANWPTLLAVLTGPIGVAVLLITRNWDTIKAGAQAVWDFIRGGWDSLFGFFNTVISKIAGIATRIWAPISDTFRTIINTIIDLWNRLHFTLPKVDLGPLGKLGGGTIGVPQIPHLAQGGLITGDGLVFAHAGEVITPAPQAGSSVTFGDVYLSDGADVDLLLAKLGFALRAGRL